MRPLLNTNTRPQVRSLTRAVRERLASTRVNMGSVRLSFLAPRRRHERLNTCKKVF